MVVIHFVPHHADEPLCGKTDGGEWIESSRAESVTCPRCSARLTGVRTAEGRADAQESGPRGERDE